MQQPESNPDSLGVFTTEKWLVQLGMAARGIACCSKCGTSGRIAIQVPAFKLPACSRVTAHSSITSWPPAEISVKIHHRLFRQSKTASDVPIPRGLRFPDK